MPVIKLVVFISVLICVTVIVVLFPLQKASDLPAVQTATSPGTIRYLPLGDSYSIGESVAKPDRWPNQLAARFSTSGKTLRIVANPSVTGYTSQDLIDRELPLVKRLKPDFVTILIGVNDYVQQVPAATFQQNLDYIINMLQKQLAKPQNILLVTIPDYGKTPTGARFGDPAASEAGIKQFNEIIQQLATKHTLPVADIFPVSQAVAGDQSLIAGDGLHPSAKEYAAWTNVIFQAMKSNALPL